MLNSGTRLGVYEIAGLLGAGGMGEVYRARDTNLNRDVALKVLPEILARDPERMARFKREAQVLASLNHPNIATIYGFEESGGVRALVMELVEGQTLAELLENGKSKSESGKTKFEDGNSKLEIRKSATTGTANFEFQISSFEGLPIAKQIAEGLEYAHEHGVIHRDLKPANVKITPEGTVKVLDFGLAKVLSPSDSSAVLDPANSPSLTAMATQAGMLLGTAAYMSPEQAKGQRVDRRADIWAFGCVLFEMLTGRKPFEGETISDVLASVIKTEPDWSAIPETAPASVQRLVRRCLQKDVRQRLQAIGEARITIEEALSGDAGARPAPVPAEAAPAKPRWSLLRRAVPWAVAAVFAAVALFAVLAHRKKAPPPLPPKPSGSRHRLSRRRSAGAA